VEKALAIGFHRYAITAAEVVNINSSKTSIEDLEFQPHINQDEVLVKDEVMLLKD
jgi:hypothetical protein